jgi:hypothetical protein
MTPIERGSSPTRSTTGGRLNPRMIAELITQYPYTADSGTKYTHHSYCIECPVAVFMKVSTRGHGGEEVHGGPQSACFDRLDGPGCLPFVHLHVRTRPESQTAYPSGHSHPPPPLIRPGAGSDSQSRSAVGPVRTARGAQRQRPPVREEVGRGGAPASRCLKGNRRP